MINGRYHEEEDIERRGATPPLTRVAAPSFFASSADARQVVRLNDARNPWSEEDETATVIKGGGGRERIWSAEEAEWAARRRAAAVQENPRRLRLRRCLGWLGRWLIKALRAAADVIRRARIVSLLAIMGAELLFFYAAIAYVDDLTAQTARDGQFTRFLLEWGSYCLEKTLFLSALTKVVFGVVRLLWLPVSSLWSKDTSSTISSLIRTLCYITFSGAVVLRLMGKI